MGVETGWPAGERQFTDRNQARAKKTAREQRYHLRKKNAPDKAHIKMISQRFEPRRIEGNDDRKQNGEQGADDLRSPHVESSLATAIHADRWAKVASRKSFEARYCIRIKA